MVTPQDVVVRAYELLGEYGIERGAFARDNGGRAILATDSNAIGFCSVGAIARAAVDLKATAYADHAMEILYQQIPLMPSITQWNDFVATDQEILATFRKAAGLSEPSKPVEELTEAHEQVLELV